MIVRIKSGSEADRLPAQHLDAGLYFIDQYACKQHEALIDHGEAVKIVRRLNLPVEEATMEIYRYFTAYGFILQTSQYGFHFAMYASLQDHSVFLLKCLAEPEISATDLVLSMRVSNQVKKGCVLAWVTGGSVQFVCFRYYRQEAQEL